MRKYFILASTLMVVLSSCTKQPVASFGVASSTIAAGEPVAFTNTSANASSYAWDFGDGSNSDAESPIHTFAASGTYQVTLTAFSENGKKSDLVSSEVVVGAELYAAEKAKLTRTWSMDSLTLTRPAGPNYLFLTADLWGGTNEYLYVFTAPNTVKTFRDGNEESSGTWELTSSTELRFDNQQTVPVVTLTEQKFAFSRPSSNDPSYTETLYFTAQ